MTHASSPRIHGLNRAPVRPDRAFVLYWMVAHRRLGWNFALDRAVSRAVELGLPLVILEALRGDYPWASDRLHAFALQGMHEHAERLRGGPVAYHPFVEPMHGAGKGLLEALSRRAALVVTDLFPAFFLPRMLAAAGEKLDVRLEAVDANGLLPLSVTTGPFTAAVHFRRFLQKRLGSHLLEMPSPDPLDGSGLRPAPPLPEDVLSRWPAAPAAMLRAESDALARLPVDHTIPPAGTRGGTAAARRRLARFLDERIHRYAEERNHPDAEAASGLSPYLHWGHLSAHEVFDALARREEWSPARLGAQADGKRHGWWGMGRPAEAFLDQLVTWRELGFVHCHHVPGYNRYESLPEWARATLEEHATDPRPYVYDLEELAAGRTHDDLWNAAQRELLVDGTIHNYLRMLWGKKILEWTRHPREALDVMIELNNRYALDGRDPNSYSGIFWTLGRFDRGWPERPVYGKVRTMTSQSARRKLDLEGYLARWGSQPSLSV
ncbi:MAG: deoxyribodipyrimidine photolyase [Gemmatimonadota bacterium]